MSRKCLGNAYNLSGEAPFTVAKSWRSCEEQSSTCSDRPLWHYSPKDFLTILKDVAVYCGFFPPVLFAHGDHDPLEHSTPGYLYLFF
jgi:hypothetical protein